MAAQGGILFQEKVSRLLSRREGKPVLKPNKPLALKDTVANRKLKKGEATCITEMSILMACWKQNNFVDGLCSSEINSFYTCVEAARAAMKNKSEQTSSQGGRLHPKQATTLLKRYPNLRTEI
ncbi:coiled-coil-helix-coiled-coil-helix domain-containing protein 1 [Toxotes jaculatrix]|uniref:coiled-coil-helix-coiled-coil-helix domain-containing protein 1 n=1 Tax=Toxotes jaculatrix TaxID=941984 RepID=UPI001B3ADDD7|nr:coiled-coil-helix-coiled-coil-helix domain-containing protein 1 [Toxotes jaculatrix]